MIGLPDECIHVAEVNGRAVRFFPTAIGADPWVAWPDVVAAARLGRWEQIWRTKRLRKFHAHAIRDVETKHQGRVLIVPNWMARAVIWVQARDAKIPDTANNEFLNATDAARDAVLVDLPVAGTA